MTGQPTGGWSNWRTEGTLTSPRLTKSGSASPIHSVARGEKQGRGLASPLHPSIPDPFSHAMRMPQQVGEKERKIRAHTQVRPYRLPATQSGWAGDRAQPSTPY